MSFLGVLWQGLDRISSFTVHFTEEPVATAESRDPLGTAMVTPQLDPHQSPPDTCH